MQTICGEGYRPGSYLCGACDDGYFEDPAFGCVACPVERSVSAFIAQFAFLIGMVLVAAVLMLGLLWMLTTIVGGSFRQGLARVVDLLVWVFLLMQPFSQVVQMAKPGLPAYLWSFLESALVFALQAPRSAPASCFSAPPLLRESVVLSVAVVLTIMTTKLMRGARPDMTMHQGGARRLLILRHTT